MRVGVIGRSGLLLRAIGAVAAAGHAIAFVQTCRGQDHDPAGEADFARAAAAHGARFLPPGPAGPDAVRAWRDSGADVAISVNWPTLLSADALAACRFGVLNAHAGDLPRYRGNACPNWAILRFEPSVTLTVHRMEAALDAGPWLWKTSLPIDERTYVGDVYDWLAAAVPDAFTGALDRLERLGEAAFVPQDAAVRPLRAYPRRPEDARIDWRAGARRVLALVRASSRPFAGAFTTLEGGPLVRIWRARAHDPGFDFLAEPGQVCFGLDGSPVIAAGDGMVEIEECSADGLDDAATKAAILRSLRQRLA